MNKFLFVKEMFLPVCVCVCVSLRYLISCKYSCVRSASCGRRVWKPYAQWDKLAVCRAVIQWNNIYRSAFRAVANGFRAQAGKRLCVCLYVSVLSSRCSETSDWTQSQIQCVKYSLFVLHRFLFAFDDSLLDERQREVRLQFSIVRFGLVW